MKKMFFILILALITSNCLRAQGINNLWLSGYANYANLPYGGTNIDFISGSPNDYYEPNRKMEIQITTCNVADNLGNLLFYSNGAWIANRDNKLMVNGDTLNPSSYTKSSYKRGFRLIGSQIALKCPGSDSLYYLIHQTVDDGQIVFADKCYYSIIDMNQDSGRGAVIDKNHIMFYDTLTAQMSVCKHANGRDWWVIIPQWNHPAYYVYLLTPNGLTFSSFQTIGTRLQGSGQATFSIEGNLYASYDNLTDLEVFDFDRCMGQFSNPRHVAINDSMLGIGVSISPNNRFIYASSGKYLYQFDVQNLQNYQTVAVWDSFYSPSYPFATFFSMQELMQDNKIYINTGNGTDYLHVINYPDSLGLACDLQQHSLQLPTYNAGSTPYYPNYSLGPVVGSICDSLSVGLKDNNVQSAELRLNPNPCHDNVWINYHFPNNKDGWLEIYNSIGKLVVKRRMYWSSTQLLLYTSELSSGIYFVKLYDDSKFFISSGKLIKN